MTHALLGRKQSPEHIANRMAVMQEYYATKRTGVSPEAREKAYAGAREWRKRNQDKVKAHKRKFQETRRAHRCFYQQTREAERRRAIPPWADMDAIKGMYELCGIFRAAGLDLHVDHIVPLKGKIVSGLHVENNLQLLPKLENLSKKNKFTETI